MSRGHGGGRRGRGGPGGVPRAEAPGEGAEAPPARGPVRTCVGCRARRPAAELTRLVAVRGADKGADGGADKTAVVPDPGRRAPGRGAWVCADDPSCLARALLKGRLAKALRTPDPDLEALRGRTS